MNDLWDIGPLTHEDIVESASALVAAPKAQDLEKSASPAALFPASDVSPGTLAALTRSIKAAFLGAKHPEEIALAAEAMPLRDWMDFAIRLMPKEVAVKGQFQMQALVGQIGPLRREAPEG